MYLDSSSEKQESESLLHPHSMQRTSSDSVFSMGEMEQVAVDSAKESSSLPSVAPIPQASRWTAAMQVLAGHLIIFDTLGYIGSWGFFQAYYINSLHQSTSAISWIGSVQLFLLFFIGAFSGRALDAGYLHSTLFIGCALQTLGIFAASWARTYTELFLSQGVCVGVGDGLVFTPMISLISTYYTDQTRALAVGFAAAGAGFGGMVFPAIAKQLLGTIGVGWTLRVMGFVFVANSSIALALVRVRVGPRKVGPLMEWSAFRELPFSLYAAGIFLTLWGLYFAYYYIGIFGTSIIHISHQESFLLIMALNAIGLAGRTIPAWLAPRCGGVLKVLIFNTFFAGILLYLWALVHNLNGLIPWIIVYGFFANAVQSLFVGAVGSLTIDKQKMGARTGMIFTTVSIACLTGPPIAGALIDARGGSFLYAQMFGGTVLVLGSIALAGAAWAKK